MEGWLLVSFSSSSSSMQGEMKGLSAEPGSRAWLLYMCRLRGPSRLQDEGPEAAGAPAPEPLPEARLKGLEWSKRETAMEALVLAPGGGRRGGGGRGDRLASGLGTRL